MGEKTTPEIHVLTRHKSDLKNIICIYMHAFDSFYSEKYFMIVCTLVLKEYDVLFSKTAC